MVRNEEEGCIRTVKVPSLVARNKGNIVYKYPEILLI